jgi:hypothetical protein
MPDEVIRNYIASTGKAYRLSADDILYLNGQGVSPAVISALQTAAPAVAESAPPPPGPAPAPAYNPAPQPPGVAVSATVGAAPPPPPEVNFEYFHDQLAPFGTWVNINGVMYWRPDQAIAVNPDWRPYYDMGQWVETDNGLYWQSDYTWGDIPFHYGRWVLYPGSGWLWCPDYVWGPAWVFWREDAVDGAIGWAPLPVGAVFVNGGFMFNGVAVGLDFDFGLSFGCFTFVGYDHFHEGFFRMRGHEWAYHIDHDRLHSFYSHSVVRNDFHRDDHGRFVNNGIGRDRVEHLTHVEHANFEERTPVGDRNRLATTRTEDQHRTSGGSEGPGHPQAQDHAFTGNPGISHETANPAHESTFSAGHSGMTSGSASAANKVYRPPTSGMGGGAGMGGGHSMGGGGTGGGGSAPSRGDKRQ